MRMPLVLTIRCRIGRALRRVRSRKTAGCNVGSPPEICTTSASPSLATIASSIRSNFVERTVLDARSDRFRVADRTSQVAMIIDLDDRQTRVLHVIGTQAAVVRAAVLHCRIEPPRHLGRLDEDLAAGAVVGDVVADQHALGAVHRAPLVHVHALALEQDLRFDRPQAFAAYRGGRVVEQVGTGLSRHSSLRNCRTVSGIYQASQIAARSWMPLSPMMYAYGTGLRKSISRRHIR